MVTADGDGVRRRHSASQKKVADSKFRKTSMIDSHSFYGEYYGHTVPHLKAVVDGLRQDKDSLVFFVGDSCEYDYDVFRSVWN